MSMFAPPPRANSLSSAVSPSSSRASGMDWEPSPSSEASTSTLPTVLAGFSNQEKSGKILPCKSVKEDGLMRIDASTLHDVVNGAYAAKIAAYHVVDCRFDYEFNGGHVVGAVNLQSEADIEAHLLEAGRGAYAGGSLPLPSVSGLPDAAGQALKTVVVFHCEFSQKRGPELAKLLRKKDRAANQKSYPALFYPELYILEGGYCDFYRQRPQLCNPRAYISMDDPAHVARRASEIHTMRKFHRAQSWQGSRTAPVLQPSRPQLRSHSSVSQHAPSQRITYERSGAATISAATALARSTLGDGGSSSSGAAPMDDHEDENTFADSSFADSSFEDSFEAGSPARPSSRLGGGGSGALSMLGGAGSLKPSSLAPPALGRMGSLQPPPRLNRLERASSSAPQALTLGSAFGGGGGNGAAPSAGPRAFARAQSWQDPGSLPGAAGGPSGSRMSMPSRPPLAGIFPLAFSAGSAAKGRRRAGSIIGEEDGDH